MRIELPGPVTPRITLMGRNESCVYLVDGGDDKIVLLNNLQVTDEPT